MSIDERIRVLVADNLPYFAAQCAQFLDRAGYHVFQAHSLEEARRHLERTHIHVAILDMRLVSNHDPKDISGVELAMSSDPSIAKIISPPCKAGTKEVQTSKISRDVKHTKPT